MGDESQNSLTIFMCQLTSWLSSKLLQWQLLQWQPASDDASGHYATTNMDA